MEFPGRARKLDGNFRRFKASGGATSAPLSPTRHAAFALFAIIASAQNDKFVMLDGRIMNPDARFESITGVVIIATLTHESSIHKKER